MDRDRAMAGKSIDQFDRIGRDVSGVRPTVFPGRRGGRTETTKPRRVMMRRMKKTRRIFILLALLCFVGGLQSTWRGLEWRAYGDSIIGGVYSGDGGFAICVFRQRPWNSSEAEPRGLGVSGVLHLDIRTNKYWRNYWRVDLLTDWNTLGTFILVPAALFEVRARRIARAPGFPVIEKPIVSA